MKGLNLKLKAPRKHFLKVSNFDQNTNLRHLKCLVILNEAGKIFMNSKTNLIENCSEFLIIKDI